MTGARRQREGKTIPPGKPRRAVQRRRGARALRRSKAHVLPDADRASGPGLRRRSQRNADKTRPAAEPGSRSRARRVAPTPSRSTGHDETLIPAGGQGRSGRGSATAEASGPWSVQAGAFRTRAGRWPGEAAPPGRVRRLRHASVGRRRTDPLQSAAWGRSRTRPRLSAWPTGIARASARGRLRRAQVAAWRAGPVLRLPRRDRGRVVDLGRAIGRAAWQRPPLLVGPFFPQPQLSLQVLRNHIRKDS